MSNVLNLREQYREKQDEVEQLREEMSNILNQLQNECDHSSLAELDYSPSGELFNAQPPRRICLICGLEEEGWGCGWDKLGKGKVVEQFPHASYSKFYKLRSLNFELKPIFGREE